MPSIQELLANSREIDARLKQKTQPEPVVVAHQDAVIVDHESRIEALEAQVQELLSAKPRRGRPRKSDAA